MKKIIKNELGKALKNGWFISAVILGSVAAFFSFLYQSSAYVDWCKVVEEMKKLSTVPYDPEVQAYILANSWIGGEQYSLGYAVFFLIFPILTVVPYGWSYAQEERSGYIRLIAVKGKKRKYYWAKAAAVFLSGGLTMGIPLCMNGVLTSMCFPNLVPDSLSLYIAMSPKSMWSEVFFESPGGYILLYLMLDFLFGGLIAMSAYGLTFLVRSKLMALFVPFVMCLVFRQISMAYVQEYEICPLYFLHGMPICTDVNGWIVAAWGTILLLIGIFGIKRGEKRELL